MRSRRDPQRPTAMSALRRADSGTRAPGRPPDVLVEDHLEPRLRIPADLLRCVIAVAEIAVLTGVAVLASATATGVEVDFVGASNRLPTAVLHLIALAGNLALPILPVVLAIRLGLLRQFRRLIEAIATGGIAVGVVAVINVMLHARTLRHMQSVLHTASKAAGHQPALDGYLAGVVAYVTVVGLRGHAHLRPAFLTGLGLYGLATLADRTATVLSLLITVLIGSAIGSGLRYALGTISGRPTASDIASALTTPEHRIVAIRRA